jgi:hypothetical protein
MMANQTQTLERNGSVAVKDCGSFLDSRVYKLSKSIENFSNKNPFARVESNNLRGIAEKLRQLKTKRRELVSFLQPESIEITPTGLSECQ